MDSERLINVLSLDSELLINQFKQILFVLDDPIRVHAVWKVIQRSANNNKCINDYQAFDYNKTVEQLTQHEIANKMSKFRFDVNGNPINREFKQSPKVVKEPEKVKPNPHLLGKREYVPDQKEEQNDFKLKLMKTNEPENQENAMT